MSVRRRRGVTERFISVPATQHYSNTFHSTGQDAWALAAEGSAETPAGLGPLGQEAWFVPKFTGERDPTVLSYMGLQGEENRAKLAELFLRPTSWDDYCRLVSADNCQTPDSVAARPPASREEQRMYFVQDVYTGYFRATEKNDCATWPDNCTGHIVE